MQREPEPELGLEPREQLGQEPELEPQVQRELQPVLELEPASELRVFLARLPLQQGSTQHI